MNLEQRILEKLGLDDHVEPIVVWSFKEYNDN
jgi:hypothetical protein